MVNSVSNRPSENEDLRLYTPPPLEQETEEEKTQRKELESRQTTAAANRDKKDFDTTLPGTNNTNNPQAQIRRETTEKAKTIPNSAKPESISPKITYPAQQLAEEVPEKDFTKALENARTTQEVQDLMTSNPEMTEAIMGKVLKDGLDQVKAELKDTLEKEPSYHKLAKANTAFLQNLGNLDPNKFKDPGLRAAAAMMSTSPELKQNAEAIGALFAGIEKSGNPNNALENFPTIATKLNSSNPDERLEAAAEMLKLAQKNIGASGSVDQKTVFADIIKSNLESSNISNQAKEKLAQFGAELMAKADPDKIPELAKFSSDIAKQLETGKSPQEILDSLKSYDNQDAIKAAANLVLDLALSQAESKGISLSKDEIKSLVSRLVGKDGKLNDNDIARVSREISQIIVNKISRGDYDALKAIDKEGQLSKKTLEQATQKQTLLEINQQDGGTNRSLYAISGAKDHDMQDAMKWQAPSKENHRNLPSVETALKTPKSTYLLSPSKEELHKDMDTGLVQGIYEKVHEQVKEQLGQPETAKALELAHQAIKDSGNSQGKLDIDTLTKVQKLRENLAKDLQSLTTAIKPEKLLSIFNPQGTEKVPEISQQQKDVIQKLVTESLAQGLGELKAKVTRDYPNNPEKQREILGDFINSPQEAVDRGHFGENSGKDYSIEQMLSDARTRELEILNGNKPLSDDSQALAALVQAIPQDSYNPERMAEFLRLADKSREDKVSTNVKEPGAKDYSAEMHKEYFSILNNSLQNLNPEQAAQTIKDVLSNSTESEINEKILNGLSTALANLKSEKRAEIFDGLARAITSADYAKDSEIMKHIDSKLVADSILALKHNPNALNAALEKALEGTELKDQAEKISNLVNAALKVIDDPKGKISEGLASILKASSENGSNLQSILNNEVVPEILSKFIEQAQPEDKDATIELVKTALDLGFDLTKDTNTSLSAEHREDIAKIVAAGIIKSQGEHANKLAEQITTLIKNIANSDGDTGNLQLHSYEAAAALETLSANFSPEEKAIAMKALLEISQADYGSEIENTISQSEIKMDPGSIEAAAEILASLQNESNNYFENTLTALNNINSNPDLSAEEKNNESFAVMVSALNQSRAELNADKHATTQRTEDQKRLSRLIEPNLKGKIKLNSGDYSKTAEAVAGLVVDIDSEQGVKNTLSALHELSELTEKTGENPNLAKIKELLDKTTDFIRTYEEATAQSGLSANDQAAAIKGLIDSLDVPKDAFSLEKIQENLGAKLETQEDIEKFRENLTNFNDLIDSATQLLNLDSAKELTHLLAGDRDLSDKAQETLRKITDNPELLQEAFKLTNKEVDAIDTLLDAREALLGADGKASADDVLTIWASAAADNATRAKITSEVDARMTDKITSRTWDIANSEINRAPGGAIGRGMAQEIASVIAPKSISYTKNNMKPYFDEIGLVGMLSSPEFKSQLEQIPGMSTDLLESKMTDAQAIEYLGGEKQDPTTTLKALYALSKGDTLENFLANETLKHTVYKETDGKNTYSSGYTASRRVFIFNVSATRYPEAGSFSDKAQNLLNKVDNLSKEIYQQRGLELKKIQTETDKAMEILGSYMSNAMEKLDLKRSDFEKMIASTKEQGKEEEVKKTTLDYLTERDSAGKSLFEKMAISSIDGSRGIKIQDEEKLKEKAQDYLDKNPSIKIYEKDGDKYLAFKTDRGQLSVHDAKNLQKGINSNVIADQSHQNKYSEVLNEEKSTQNSMLDKFFDKAEIADPNSNTFPTDEGYQITRETLTALKAGNNRFISNNKNSEQSKRTDAQETKTSLDYLIQRSGTDKSLFEKMTGKEFSVEELKTNAQKYLNNNPSVRIFQHDSNTYIGFTTQNNQISAVKAEDYGIRGKAFWANDELVNKYNASRQ